METDSLDVLKKYFGYHTFRPQQESIINHVLAGCDALALLPTGGGKSLCYQIPSIILDGICIVISPLVALIKDQVTKLNNNGIKAIGITSGLSHRELDDILDNCIYGNYKFLYLSPERSKQELVRERIARMKVNLIAVDEAHCISEWGHDFRPAYLELKKLRELQPSCPILALTATATQEVQNDILRHLNLNQPKTFKTSYERKNIDYSIHRTSDKRRKLVELTSQTDESTIVYVRSRKNAVEYAQLLNYHNVKSSFYHGGLENSIRMKNAEEWMNNRAKVMVATSAFGMGIDKPDVRQVIHLQLPDSLENYYQETGRAGRDGLSSAAHFIYNPNDIDHAYNQFVKNLPNVDFLKELYRKINSYLKISYGEGSGETYSFNFSEFANKYELSGLRVFSGLKTLERFGVLELSQNYDRLSRVRFRESASLINNFTENRPENHAVIQAILRSYGSSKHQSLQINPRIIAARSGTSEKIVSQTLGLLKKYNLAEVTDHTNSFSISFLVPREDSRTINRFKSVLEKHTALKRSKLQSVINFVQEKQICLNTILLDYFDEGKHERCGRCSNCRKKNFTGNQQKDKSEVINYLESDGLTIRQLSSVSGYDEAHLVDSLRMLIEQGKVGCTPDRRYFKI